MRAIFISIFATLSVLAGGHAENNFSPPALTGQTFIHDPSTVVQDGSRYYVFGTGPGIRTKSSPDLVQWEAGKPVFRDPPAWINNFVPTFGEYFWAPDIIRMDENFSSTTPRPPGRNPSPSSASPPTRRSTRRRPIICGPMAARSSRPPTATASTPFDPSVFRDDDGKLWLAFGSYWQGIFLTELDPDTGLRPGTNSPLFHLAWNNSIEAACLTRHEMFYYLFVNWGECCKGTNSTYEVRVGRAEKVTGPYLDRDGKNLADGGGSPFLRSCGRFIGPGHIGIVADDLTNGPTRFSYHYYDAATKGRSRLAIGTIDWSDGWPVPVK